MTPALLLLLFCAPAGESPPSGEPDTLVACPREFQAALSPWLAHRRKQGHRVAVTSAIGSAQALRDEVRRVAAGGSLRYVLLVGDAEPATPDERARGQCVPTHHAAAKVNVQYGSEPEIATDNWYADLDDDRVPDLAVGRLTSDTAAELGTMVRKIIDYEQNADFGTWRRQIHLVAGLGGFGALTDATIEASAKSLITQGIPPAYVTTMTYASWQSPYCPDPRRFGQAALGRLNEGSLFWVYIGHGQARALDEVYVPGGRFPILTSRDAARLHAEHGAPIACFLACYTGAFDLPRDCLAEDMLRSPGGPVAVLGGSRVTMPYAMTVISAELLRAVFVENARTLGQAILAAKRRSVGPAEDDAQRAALDAMARALYPAPADLAAERVENLDLFNLLGDPLLRLPYPRDLALEVAPAAAAGSSISVSGVSPIAGACTVELVVRRDRLTFRAPRRPSFEPLELASYTETYERANDPRLASAQLAISKGPFAVTLDVPEEARGACHVRVFVSGERDCAAGAADVRIEPAKTPTIRERR